MLGSWGGAMKKVSDVNDDVMWPRPPLLKWNQTKATTPSQERFRINIYTTLPWQQHSEFQVYDPV